MTDDELVVALAGKDPLAAEDAILFLEKRSAAEIFDISTRASPPGISSFRRFQRLGAAAGREIVPLMLERINEGDYHRMRGVAELFASFQRDEAIVNQLMNCLEDKGLSIDAHRCVIESLGQICGTGYSDFIVNFTRYGTAHPKPFAAHNNYVYDKCAYCAFEALGLMIAREPDVGRKRIAIEEALSLAMLDEQHRAGRGLSPPDYLERARWDMDEKAIDLIVKKWVQHDQKEYRKLGYTTLGEIKSVRVTRLLLDQAKAASTQQESVSALIALGEIRDQRVADAFNEWLEVEGTNRAGWDWAYSALYPLTDSWVLSVEDAQNAMGQHGETFQQLLYSRALTGDKRVEPILITALDHMDPYVRGSSGLSLARLLGQDALPYLESRDDEASDDLERCFLLAALVHAGQHYKAAQLHEGLQKLSVLPLLRTMWITDILDAFREATDFDQRAFSLWTQELRLRPRALQMFDRLRARHRTHNQDDVSKMSRSKDYLTDNAARNPKLFVSYARQDRHWLDRILTMMKPYIRGGNFDAWEDSQLRPGKWHKQIDTAMNEADGALFLVSPEFLASDYVAAHELPDLLSYAENRGVKVFWLALDHCAYETSALNEYQCHNDPNDPLIKLSEAEQSRVILELARSVKQHIGNPSS